MLSSHGAAGGRGRRRPPRRLDRGRAAPGWRSGM